MHRAIPLLALVAIAALTGCVSLFGEDTQPSGTAVTEKVDATLSDVDTLTMTMSWTISGGGQPVRYEARVAYRRPNLVNLTYREPAQLAGAKLVGNGTNVSVVNPSTGTYTTAPVVSNGTGLSSLFLGLNDVENPRFLGNETVAGDDAVKLSYAVSGSEVSLFLQGGTATSAVSENDDEANVTVWVDRDTWLPVEATMNMTGFESPVNISYTYEDVRTGVDLSDARFETTPGPAVDERVDTMWEALLPEGAAGYTAHEELVSDAGAAAPPATLPDGFTFTQGFSVPLSQDGTERRYRLFYTNESTVREVHYITEPISILDGSDSITVDGRRVNVSVASGTTITHYQCAEGAYSVLGRQPAEALAPSIDAIGCPEPA